MHREARERVQSSDEDVELNTPLLDANTSSAPLVGESKAERHPSPDSSTPLLGQEGTNTLLLQGAASMTCCEVCSFLHLQEEEKENQLTASLPSSLGHSTAHAETR